MDKKRTRFGHFPEGSWRKGRAREEKGKRNVKFQGNLLDFIREVGYDKKNLIELEPCHRVRRIRVFCPIPLGLGRNGDGAPFLQEDSMRSRHLFSRFAQYVSLNILGMLGLSCYILADTFFVAKALGAFGLAALNFSISIYSLIHGAGLLLGVGGATRYRIHTAQKNIEMGRRVYGTTVKIGALAGGAFLLLGLLGTSGLARLLGADASTLPLTVTYLRTIFVFAPFFILNNILLAFVRNDGNPALAMKAMLFGSFSNILLDYLLMFPLNLGMFGAAFATGLAPILSIIVMVPHLRRSPGLRGSLKLTPQWKLLPDFLDLGMSSFILEISSAAVLMVTNRVILKISGNFGVAAYGIVANLALVGMALFAGLAQGVQPLVSSAHGKKQNEEIRKLQRYAGASALLLSFVLFGIVLGYRESIVEAFNGQGNDVVGQMAEEGLLLYFLGFFLVGYNILEATFASATENTQEAFRISLLRGFLFILPLILLLGRFYGMKGVWLSFILTEALVLLLTAAGKLRHRQSQKRGLVLGSSPVDETWNGG